MLAPELGCGGFHYCGPNGINKGSGTCNGGRYFDVQRQLCDWPENVRYDEIKILKFKLTQFMSGSM